MERGRGAAAGERRSQARADAHPAHDSRYTLTPRRLRSPAATSIAAQGFRSLSGAYIYGDFQTGIIWALRETGERSPGRPSWRGRRCISWRSPKRTAASSCWSTTIGLTRFTAWSLLQPSRREARFPRKLVRERALRLGARRTACSGCLALRNQLRALVRRGDRRAVPGHSWKRHDRLSMARASGSFPKARCWRGRSRSSSSPASPQAAAGSKPRSCTENPRPGGHTRISGTTCRTTRNWSCRGSHSRRSRMARQRTSTSEPTGLPRGPSVSCAITPGSRRRRRFSASSPPRRWV